MINRTKQVWNPGEIVKVGFVSGLTVLAAIPTPGDGLPDAYILARGIHYYSFTPHHGLCRITANEAQLAVLEGREEAEERSTQDQKRVEMLRQAAMLNASLIAMAVRV